MYNEKHILIIPSWFSNAGVTTVAPFVFDQAAAIKTHTNNKVGIIYLSTAPSMDVEENETVCDVPVLRSSLPTLLTKGRRISFFPILKQYDRLLKQYIRQYGKPDIIHAHSVFNGAIAAEYFYRRHQIPYVITEHYSGIGLGTLKRWEVRVAKRTLGFATAVCAVSRFLSASMQSQLSIDNPIYMPNTFSQLLFDYVSSSTLCNNIKTRTNGHISFIIVGRIDNNKNVTLAVKAFREILIYYPTATLTIVGDGNESHTVSNLVKELSISNSVQVLGQLDRTSLIERLTQSSALLVTSNFETFGMTVVEAAALMIPVIATDCGGPTEILKSGNFGFLVEKNNKQQLVEAMRKIPNSVNDFNLQNGQDYVFQNFTPAIVANRLEKLYSHILLQCCQYWALLIMSFKNVGYIARLAAGSSTGILSKVQQSSKAIESLGVSCHIHLCQRGGISAPYSFAGAIWGAKEDILIIRSDHYSMLFCVVPLLIKRLLGKVIILDVANPATAACWEARLRKEPAYVRFARVCILHCTYPLLFWCVSRVVEYSTEGIFFSCCAKRKILLVGNGVDVNQTSYRSKFPAIIDGVIRFGMAGHIAFWHGIDRFLYSMSSYNTTHDGESCYRVELYIVGDGFEIRSLKSLVRKLNLEKSVFFKPNVDHKGLEHFYEKIHIGLSNLANHRKGLTITSDLKTRDMAARGVPFLLSGDDPDFVNSGLRGFYSVPNSEETIDLESVMSWYTSLDVTDHMQLREYAEEFLSYERKMRLILNRYIDLQYVSWYPKRYIV